MYGKTIVFSGRYTGYCIMRIPKVNENVFALEIGQFYIAGHIGESLNLGMGTEARVNTCDALGEYPYSERKHGYKRCIYPEFLHTINENNAGCRMVRCVRA